MVQRDGGGDRQFAGVVQEFPQEPPQGDFRRGHDKQAGEDGDIDGDDNNHRKKRSAVVEVGLTLADHEAGEGEVKSPGKTEESEHPPVVRGHVGENGGNAVNGQNEDAVNWKKIGRKGNPRARAIRKDVPAILSYTEIMHLPALKFHPERMGQFMTKNIDAHRTRQTKKHPQPENDAQREKPERLVVPKLLMDGRIRKYRKKCPRQQPAGNHQEGRHHELDPALGDARRHRTRRCHGDRQAAAWFFLAA